MASIWQAAVLNVGVNTGRGHPAASGLDGGAVCIPNISPREQRKRLVFGVAQFVISLTVLTALLARGTNRWWRLPLGLLFWGAAAGVFQWRDKT